MFLFVAALSSCTALSFLLSLSVFFLFFLGLMCCQAIVFNKLVLLIVIVFVLKRGDCQGLQPYYELVSWRLCLVPNQNIRNCIIVSNISFTWKFNMHEKPENLEFNQWEEKTSLLSWTRGRFRVPEKGFY